VPEFRSQRRHAAPARSAGTRRLPGAVNVTSNFIRTGFFMRRNHSILLFSLMLFLFSSACSEDDPITPQSAHDEAIGMALFRGDSLVASILRGVPSDTLRAVAGVKSEDYDIRFYDEDEHLFEAHDDDKTFSWEIADPAIVEVVQDSGKAGEFEFRLRGLAPGTTTIEFFIMHAGHSDFRTGKWPVRVD
jgi:hypothetical protein